MSYGIFAKYYDQLNSQADYPRRAAQLLRIFERFGKTPSLMLDAACGSGGFMLPFLQAGIDVIGADSSPGMLWAAREKTSAAGFSPLLLNQRLCELDLYGTVDGAVCTFDSLNHIETSRELRASIARISLFLEPESLFLFDVNTLYKHREILAGQTFIFDKPEVFCVWQNTFDPQSGRIDMLLDFFTPEKGVYNRYSEDFSEYIYDDALLREILEAAQLNLLETLDGDTFGAPRGESQRILYVAQKQKSGKGI